MSDSFVLAQPQRVVQRADEQRLGDGAFRVFLDAEPDGVALGFFENDLRESKQRIRSAFGFDFACEQFNG
jgi:hypothetical protein